MRCRRFRVLTKRVTKLVNRVAWLERHIRASGTAPEADFDNHSAAVGDLAATVRRGHKLAARLLGERERWVLQSTLDEAATRLTKIQELTSTALTANEVLISTAYETPEHQAAAARFRTAYIERKALVETHHEKAAAVNDARQKLADAKKYRDTHSADIAAGQAAEGALRTRMRTAVTDAIRDGALPPMWFHTALGPTAPQHNTKDWLDVATEVLTHRALYDITHPLLALGPEPDRTDNSPSARSYWYLSDRLRNL